jgi:hypothetical protein
MKTMTLSLALLPLLGLRAGAQDTPWSDLALGDRVEVTFFSGATIRGTLVSSGAKTRTVDYSRERELTLDLTWEYPGLSGTMTLTKKEFKGVRKLRILDETARARPTPVVPRGGDDNGKALPAKPVAPNPPVEPKPEATPDEKAAKEAEEQKKALEFYAKYPPPYWGPERHTLDVQKQARGQALSPAERDFEGGYATLWEKGRAASLPNPAEPKKE